MRLRLLARALMGLGALAMTAHAGADKLDAELAAIVSDPAHPLASLSVLAIRGGEVVYHRQFGHRWIDTADPARSKPANAQTLYRIASISKLVTTLGVLRLVETGRLSLDRDIGDYLGYGVRNPHFPEAPITLRMLLGHTSSLRDDAGYSWPAGRDLREVLSPGGALHGNGSMWSREATPGKFFHYANLPWGVVGTIMEKVSGERFDRLMRRLVLEPLGMQGGFNPAEMPPAKMRDIATLYRKRPANDDEAAWNPKGPWIAQVDDYSAEPAAPRAGPDYAIGSNGTVFGPQGNLRASAADLSRVMLMLMGEGELEGRRFLERRTVALLLSRQWRYDARNGDATCGSSRERCQAWGLGNQHFLDVGGPGRGDRLVEGGGFTGVGHHGVAWGLTGAFAFDPRTRKGLIFLTGGPGFDPETYPGIYSSFHRHEERILTAVYRHALAAKRD